MQMTKISLVGRAITTLGAAEQVVHSTVQYSTVHGPWTKRATYF